MSIVVAAAKRPWYKDFAAGIHDLWWDKSATNAAVLTVKCPACTAVPGERCYGRYSSTAANHAERVRAFLDQPAAVSA